MEDWNKADITNIMSKQESAFIYFYTPMCGTCQVAGRMLEIVEEMTGGIFGKADLNYMPDLAIELKIESVPCLLILQNGLPAEKVYAFRSVPNMLGIVQRYLDKGQ
ncbi:thiol reductase thioredoxin [Siminovitchia terrae]|uniref:Thioredoxin n=1 Tax=Siminovitchia terrae TaxID=1914933 RepID=A0A429X697_SIMTE|nr:thioredoxin family protein [Siminovitchia terrae]RST58946.1 thioredoxin [Siminovitchia terrae]GIN95105.1 thiol reductase thioredoxin [Siminovitchia terrae]